MDKAWLYVKDIFIMSLGLLAFTTGTYYSIHDIVNRLSKSEESLLLIDSLTSAQSFNTTALMETWANTTTALYNSSSTITNGL